MSHCTVGRSFVIGLQVIAHDPFGKQSLLSQSAGSIDEDRFLLMDQSVANFWILRGEA